MTQRALKAAVTRIGKTIATHVGLLAGDSVGCVEWRFTTLPDYILFIRPAPRYLEDGSFLVPHIWTIEILQLIEDLKPLLKNLDLTYQANSGPNLTYPNLKYQNEPYFSIGGDMVFANNEPLTIEVYLQRTFEEVEAEEMQRANKVEQKP